MSEKQIDVNTVSHHPTHFLRAVELIYKAREKYNVPSENWPHPTDYIFGIPNDNYYAEVWTDGMDWQPSYWVIEEHSLRKPEIQPLIIFNQNEARNQFNSYDFRELIHAMLYYRRDILWEKKDNYGYFTDSIWPFLTLFKDETRYQKMKLYAFQHASQTRIIFWLNTNFIPEVYRDKRTSDRYHRNQEEKYDSGI